MTGNSAFLAPVIEVEGLTRSFRSRWRHEEICAVRDVSLQVEQGRVVAFVGPNGAGKTTTIHALLGMIRPNNGQVRLFGRPAGCPEVCRRTGYQSEIFNTYGFKTAESALYYYGVLAEMPPREIVAAASRQLARLGLSRATTRKIQGFSKGMLQRLGLAQALLHQPDLLILDEPSSGLDPEGRKLIADIILEEKNRGATVFLSSHILSDVERTCDHVIIISQGRVVFSQTMAQIHEGADDWEIEVREWTPAARETVTGAVIRDHERSGSVVHCKSSDKNELLRRLLAADAQLGEVRQSRTLEDIYMHYAGGTSSG